MHDRKLDPSQPLVLLTVEEAAQELRVNTRTLYAMLADGRINAFRPRGTDRTLIPRQALINLLDAWTPGRGPNTGKKAKDADAEGGSQPSE